MSGRRVLLLHSSSGRYGADRQLALLATGLDRARYDPLVVLPEPGPLAADLAGAGVQVLIRPLAVLRRELLNPLGAAELSRAMARDTIALTRLIRARRIALVHSNTSVILGGAAAAALARVPHVWHVREIYSRFGHAWPPYRRVLERAAALVCVSEATAAQFSPGAPARTIYDALAVDARRAPREPARRALGLNPDTPTVAVLGRISEWKGQDVLARALAEPALRERGVVGLIAGDAWPTTPERRERLEAQADRLGLRERLRLLGFRDDVDNVLGAADVIAVPSTEPDPLPNSALEAAAAGCAVVASDIGGLPEILRDGETGRLFPAGDHRGLARVVAGLLDDPPARERLGAAAAADVRARFSPARLLDEVQALYDELV